MVHQTALTCAVLQSGYKALGIHLQTPDPWGISRHRKEQQDFLNLLSKAPK